MSLLEDVFLEDEAGEAQDLERIIEGDEYEERPRSPADNDENSGKEDEAEEDKRRVDPTSDKPKRVIRNPRFVLNPARLTGPRGIQVLPDHFKDFKFKGKGHEKNDLDLVLKKLEHWAYRLYPKFKFEDCLKKIETLGKKSAVTVQLRKIRLDMLTSDETIVQDDSSGDEAAAAAPAQALVEDEFDKLLQQQIEIARATPASSSVNKTPLSERSSLMPRVSASPSINDEQRVRMLRNRQMAEEKRLARLKQNTSQEKPNENTLRTTGDMPHVDLVTDKPNENSLETQISAAIPHVDLVSDVNVTRNMQSNNDIVELDNNGIVTPKHYVPAEKHDRSAVDDDEGKNDNVTTDVNVNSKDVVEIDDDGLVVTKSTKSYAAKKHNRSRIDSSDDDDSEPGTVDVEKHYNDTSKPKGPISNVTNRLNDDNIDELITIDDENNHSKGRKRKSNIFDSSDEDEPLVMNESITVDIHSSNRDDTNTESGNKHDTNTNKSDNYISHKETNDSVFDNLIFTNTDKYNIEDNENTEQSQGNLSNSNSETSKSIDETANNYKNVINKVFKVNEQVMDVDFSEEY